MSTSKLKKTISVGTPSPSVQDNIRQAALDQSIESIHLALNGAKGNKVTVDVYDLRRILREVERQQGKSPHYKSKS